MQKTVLITGGNKDIGLAVTRLFLERGDRVVVVARDFSSFPYQGQAEEIAFDLARVEEIPQLVKSIGGVDVLINNAGIMYSVPYDKYPIQKKDTICKVNLEAPLALIRETAGYMKQKGEGRIVNVASVAGEIGHPDIWYGVTKAGLINATKSFAKLLGPAGIVVNAVAPGPVETDMLDVIPQARKEEILRTVYTGRFAKASEVADVIFYLATTSPVYINGTCIDINNGSFPR